MVVNGSESPLAVNFLEPDFMLALQFRTRLEGVSFSRTGPHQPACRTNEQLPRDQHRARSVVENALSNGADEDARRSTPPGMTHDDEVRAQAIGGGNDLLERVAFARQALDGDALPLGVFPGEIQVPAALFFELRLHLLLATRAEPDQFIQNQLVDHIQDGHLASGAELDDAQCHLHGKKRCFRSVDRDKDLLE
jgi:hypothetical protein